MYIWAKRGVNSLALPVRVRLNHLNCTWLKVHTLSSLQTFSYLHTFPLLPPIPLSHWLLHLSASSLIISGVMPILPSWAVMWAPGSGSWLDSRRRWQSSGQLWTCSSKRWRRRWERLFLCQKSLQYATLVLQQNVYSVFRDIEGV